jgi:hypothetical protein
MTIQDIDGARELLLEIVRRKRSEPKKIVTEKGAAYVDAAGRSTARPVKVYTSGSPAWVHFVENYIPGWNGDEKNWQEYTEWIRFFAKDRGVLAEAERLLDAAERATSKVGFFTREGVTLISSKSDTKGKDETETPEKDRDGNEVDQILSTKKDNDGIGELFWVRMKGAAVGKLYADSLEFVDAPLPKHLAKLPDKDIKGRPIRKIKSEVKGDKRQVLIGGLWGLIDDEGYFIPTGPEDDAYADWSNRVIVGNKVGDVLVATGYIENEQLYPGEWYKPWADKQIYLFEGGGGGGEKEYAKGTDRAKATPTKEDKNTATKEGLQILPSGPVQKVIKSPKPYDPSRL